MFVAFARSVGNFGKDVSGRSLLPPASIGKFGHTGNYLFRTLQDAETFKASQLRYVAILGVSVLRFMVNESARLRSELFDQGFASDTKFRLRHGETYYTMGIMFHERPPSPEEQSRAKHIVKVLRSEKTFSFVLKREIMKESGIRRKLDSKSRIPWGVVSEIVACEATARSMTTILGTLRLAQGT